MYVLEKPILHTYISQYGKGAFKNYVDKQVSEMSTLLKESYNKIVHQGRRRVKKSKIFPRSFWTPHNKRIEIYVQKPFFKLFLKS